MKRFLAALLLSSVLGFSAFAQDSSPEQREKLERLSADMETMIANNAKLQTEIGKLRDELARVRDEQSSKPASDPAVAALREDLRRLAEKVQEVDRKRIEDAKNVAEQFEKLEKLIKSGLASSASSRSVRSARNDNDSAPVAPKSDKPEKGFEYVVKPGDTLLAIVVGANTQLKDKGLKALTLQQVLNANPGLKPERMQVGQKIFIPMIEK